VHCALGLSPQQGSACSAKRPSHLGWWPISARQGRVLGYGGPVGFRRRPVTRCSEEGPGSKAVGWWTHFGAAGRNSSPKEHALRRGVFSRRVTAVGATSGVVVDSSWCGEVVHGGAVLRVWLNRSERGRSGLSAVAQRRRERWHSGGRKAEEEERVLHGGGGRPL
jgi:hypothetical protein